MSEDQKTETATDEDYLGLANAEHCGEPIFELTSGGASILSFNCFAPKGHGGDCVFSMSLSQDGEEVSINISKTVKTT